MIPEDAKKFGFADGETIRLSTNRGSIEIPLEVTWQTARGYVIMPHYFGLHYQGKMIGMHANYLTDNHDIDVLTGNSRWRYTPAGWRHWTEKSQSEGIVRFFAEPENCESQLPFGSL